MLHCNRPSMPEGSAADSAAPHIKATAGAIFFRIRRKKGARCRTLCIPVVQRVVSSCSLDLDSLEQDLSSRAGQGTLKNTSVNTQRKGRGLAAWALPGTTRAGTAAAPGLGQGPCLAPGRRELHAHPGSILPGTGAAVFSAPRAPSTAAFSRGLESFCQRGADALNGRWQAHVLGRFVTMCPRVSDTLWYWELSYLSAELSAPGCYD